MTKSEELSFMSRRLSALLLAAVVTVPLSALDRAHFIELNKKGREQSKQ
jgi:hypothetical protein